jgi:diaminohydroxyphosphoribosylaminopyrimidine deaminase/5-amino-6-(5-phosphoribosylamino)uracil reductase
MTVEQDNRFMTRAMRIGCHGRMTTDPNPRVGCVIVRNGEIVGEGWHVRAGGPHAEIHALQAAGDKARGATVYVTLEPCSHHGRTPPCADALIEAGVKRVVVAMEDPNPEVSGQGLQRLRDAGIDVVLSEHHQQAEKMNPGYLKRVREGLPFLRVKLASSLDGRTAMSSGESKWITSESSRTDAHRLRAESSAILTGMGTVRADDPSLTVRMGVDKLGEFVPPTRVVLDTNFDIDANARLVTDSEAPTLIITAEGKAGSRRDITAEHVQVAEVPLKNNKLDLHAVMHLLAERGFNEVMTEAGAKLSGALLQEKLVDELILYMAPHLMGNEAKEMMHLPGMQNMNQRILLHISDITNLGDDIRITARPEVS